MNVRGRIYQPLPIGGHHIRLLSVMLGSWNEDIRCATRQVSLDSNPDYEALSYT